MSRRSIVLIAINIAIGLVVVGATAAYGMMSTTVTLSVDGKTEKLRTFGGTVGDVLESEDIKVLAGDRLNLAHSHQLKDGDEIVVEYARGIELAVDGEVSEHTVYTKKVGDALESLGVEVPQGAYVSEDLDENLERRGQTLVVSSVKDLKVVADGEEQEITTNKPLVSDVLDEAGVTLDEDDEVEPGIDAYVTPDAELKVVRIEKVDKTETVGIDFPVEVQKDSSAAQGTEVIVTRGVAGEKVEEVTLIMADGELRERIVHSSEVTKEPVTQVEKHGTKVEPVSGVWAKLAQCESGGNPRANNGGLYFGLYQFSLSTWRSVGGSGNPMDASPSEQTNRAKILQAKAGWGQWPACARKLGLL